MHFVITFAVRKTVQQHLKYEDMNSDGEKRILINSYPSLVL